VLICDDNSQIRTLVTAIISAAAGLRVVGEAADGNEAVSEAKRLQPDVILLDLAMPNRSGFDALVEVRNVAPEAQVIVFSGYSGTAVVEQVLAFGAVAHIEKGAHPAEIVAAIERAVQPARDLL